MKVQVRTVGLERLRARLSRAVNFLGNDEFREVVNEQALTLVETFKKTVATFTPGPVEDLTLATKAQKAKQGWGVYPILKRTGDMLESMVPRVRRERTNGWVVAITFRGNDRYGNRNAIKAKAHIEGTQHLPARDFTQVPQQWTQQLFNEIRRRMGWR